MQFSPVIGRRPLICVLIESVNRKGARLTCAVVGILLVLPAAAQTPIDGDSLQVDGATYRLYGIDPPDRSQICGDGWPAGYEAREYLGQLMEGRKIDCVPIVGRRNGETVAICRADGVDLGGTMSPRGAHSPSSLTRRATSRRRTPRRAQTGACMRTIASCPGYGAGGWSERISCPWSLLLLTAPFDASHFSSCFLSRIAIPA